MGKIWTFFYSAGVGVLVVVSAITIFVILMQWIFLDDAEGSPPYTTTRPARLGEQDRTVTAETKGYDNSDFLRDMDEIARGTYIYTWEPEEAEEISADDN